MGSTFEEEAEYSHSSVMVKHRHDTLDINRSTINLRQQPHAV